MKNAVLVYPHQLFRSHPALSLSELFFLVEEPLLFSQYHFHKQKLMLHRASIRSYADFLIKKGKKVIYLEADGLGDTGSVADQLEGLECVFCAELDDDWLQQRLAAACSRKRVALEFLPHPGFMAPLAESLALLRGARRYFMGSFYPQQRKKFDILIKGGKPLGGKWSYDSENRKRLPADIIVPPRVNLRSTRFVLEARDYVLQRYGSNPGSTDSFGYPTTFAQAERCLDDFLEKRLYYYGDYQDAVSSQDSFLFHSVLSPALNIGLLTPQQVVDRAAEYAQSEKIPLNSLEGFVRQVIGWREYVRAVYHLAGRRQRSSNFWQHKRSIPDTFWSGNTGIVPVDTLIRRLHSDAYCNHIERLMILGNFMLLCEFDPNQVYRWFMEFFIDAYDWVMVPNVYGMSQFADGGLIVTKPYISSSNYIRKMSDYPAGGWCPVWDGLYWRFIDRQREFFSSNPRMKVMVSQLDRMAKSKRTAHFQAAQDFLDSL